VKRRGQSLAFSLERCHLKSDRKLRPFIPKMLPSPERSTWVRLVAVGSVSFSKEAAKPRGNSLERR